jgi:3-hydroxyisobutyrate dehydrogenase-like beta-hydroxyacid dehydrogenase
MRFGPSVATPRLIATCDVSLTVRGCCALLVSSWPQMILAREDEFKLKPTGGSMKLGAKDTDMFLAAARELNVPAPYATVVRDRFTAAFAKGDGEKDFAALADRARDDAGLKK